MQVINAGNGVTVETHNHISLGKAGPLCRTILFYEYNQDATFNRQVIESHHTTKKGDILTSEPNIAALYLSFFNQATRDKFGGVNSDGKTDPLGSKDHCCIDADDFSSRGDKGP